MAQALLFRAVMRMRWALTGAILLLGGCTTKATLSPGSDPLGSPGGSDLPPPPPPSARLLRNTTLALTGAYPDPQTLEGEPSQSEMGAAIEEILSSDGLLQGATDFLYQLLQQEKPYRYTHNPVPADDTDDMDFDLPLLMVGAENAPLYEGEMNPFYLGAPSSPQYHRMKTALLHASMEPALVLRWILSTGRDFRELLSGPLTVRSQTLEDIYARREERPTRNLAAIGTPYADSLTRALGPEPWYVVDALRGPVGILGTLSFLNQRLNGRTRSALVAKSFLCKTIPISDTTGWTPPPDCDQTDPTCEFRSHVQEASCASCHISLDPMAKLWGRYPLDSPSSTFMTTGGRTNYPTESSGRYLDGTAPRFDNGTPTEGVDGLASHLVADPQFPACMTERWFVTLVGRRLAPDETRLKDSLVSAFTAHWRLKDLLRAIVRTQAFAQGSTSGAQTSSGPITDFSQVYALMNRPVANGGCQVCHIGPAAAPPSPYFGNSKDEVLAALQSRGLLAQGRQGRLAQRVASGEMPPGRRWSDSDVATLMNWLTGFEEVPLTFGPPMDRYQLGATLQALRRTPGADLGDYLQTGLIDRFIANWPIDRQRGYSTVGLVAIDTIARLACQEDTLPSMAGLPHDTDLRTVDVGRALERMTRRFLGLSPAQAGLDLNAIASANGGGAAGLSAACVALISDERFTE